MAWYDEGEIGPYLGLIIGKDKINREFITGLVNTITWFYDKVPLELASKRRTGGIKNLLKGPPYAFCVYDLVKFLETRDYEDYFEYNINWIGTHGPNPDFRFDDNRLLEIWETTEFMPVESLKRMTRLISEYLLAVDFIKPLFGWGGEFYSLLPFEGDDIRKHFFPVTFYGKAMVEVLGKDLLLSAPVWKAEEVGDGVFLQVQENPFHEVDEKKLHAVEDYLGLKDKYVRFLGK